MGVHVCVLVSARMCERNACEWVCTCECLCVSVCVCDVTTVFAQHTQCMHMSTGAGILLCGSLWYSVCEHRVRYIIVWYSVSEHRVCVCICTVLGWSM